MLYTSATLPSVNAASHNAATLNKPPETPHQFMIFEAHSHQGDRTQHIHVQVIHQYMHVESDYAVCGICMQVLDAFSLLMGLKRLRSLSLVNNKGLATLPQLHPLLQLRKLSHLMLKDSPICSLVLLQPYVAFR